MNEKTFTRSEIEDLIDNGIAKEIKSSPFKHDIILTTYVAEVDDHWWKFIIESSYNDGWSDYQFPLDAVRVIPREVISIEWVEEKLCLYKHECSYKTKVE